MRLSMSRRIFNVGLHVARKALRDSNVSLHVAWSMLDGWVMMRCIIAFCDACRLQCWFAGLVNDFNVGLQVWSMTLMLVCRSGQ